MGVTIEDVARCAGVSVSTVSRVLNRKGRISDETRARVLETAREMQHPLATEGSVGRRRTNSIGVLFNRRLRSLSADPFYGLVMVGVEECLRDEGYRIVFSTLSNREEDMGMLSELAGERRVDGLILAGCDIDIDYVNMVRSQGTPLVLVDNNLVTPKVPCAMTDNTSGAREAIEHLIGLGHRDIAFVSGPMSHSSLYERYQGFRQAMEAHRLTVRPEWVISSDDVGEFGVEGGYAAMKRLAGRSLMPSAVFAANDAMAIGVIKAAQEVGRAVPTDMSVIGFDDVEMAAHTSPPLSTVRIHKKELGYHAAKLLLELIEDDPERVPYKVVVCTELVVRGSTGPRSASPEC
ncbi:MAG: LacI family DNA-binding transcriptional regulator [Clostridia bacterium]|nr:LacI family DNA-binding transcriptional regulator [Clostridia bacterium]